MAKEMIVLKDCDFVLGEEASGPNFKCEVKKVALKGDAKTYKEQVACPDGTYSDIGPTEWELTVTFLTKWEPEASGEQTIFDFCRANAGKKMDFFFRPKARGRGYTGKVTIPPGEFQVDVSGPTDVAYTFPLDGQPQEVAKKD